MTIVVPEEDIIVIKAEEFYCEQDFLFVDLEILLQYRPYKSHYSAYYSISNVVSSQDLGDFELVDTFSKMDFDAGYFNTDAIGFYAYDIFRTGTDPSRTVYNLFVDIRPKEIKTENGYQGILEITIWIEAYPLCFELTTKVYI